MSAIFEEAANRHDDSEAHRSDPGRPESREGGDSRGPAGKKQRRLHADESDRLLRLGRVAALAEEILGSHEKATRWLHEANVALGNEIPLRHLDSDLGARQVEDVLARIAHGVYS